MTHIYISQWHWQDSDPDEPPFWRAPGPDKVTGLIDLRSNPACGTPGGTPQGFGLFTYASPQTGMAVNLGTDIEGQLRAVQISGLETELGLAPGTILSTRLSDVIAELLIVHPEISGDTRWRPIGGSLHDGETIVLQPFGRILQRPMTAQVRTNTINLFQFEYRRDVAAGVPDIVLRKWAGSTMLSIWGRMSDEHADELMPTEHRAKGWERPTSTETESFNQGDSTTLGPDQTWTEVAGNLETLNNMCQNVSDGESSYGRIGNDLASADHFVEGTTSLVNTGIDSFKQWGPCARFQVDANTSYMFMRQFKDSLTDDTNTILRLRKTVTGTRSDVGTDKTDDLVEDELLKTEISTSTLKGFLDGVEKDSQTDTTIAGNLRTGLFMFSGDHGHIACDLWKAEDLVAAGAGIRNPFGGPMVLRNPLGA